MVAIVLLDANFLYVPIQFQVDIYQGIPALIEEKTILVVPAGIKEEIVSKNQRETGREVARQGVAALKLLSQKVEEGKAMTIPHQPRSGEAVDDFLVRVAVEIAEKPGSLFPLDDVDVVSTMSRVYIATSDKELKKKCSAARIGIVNLRKKQYFSLG